MDAGMYAGMCWSRQRGGRGGQGTHRGLRRREKQPSGFHSRHPQGSADIHSYIYTYIHVNIYVYMQTYSFLVYICLSRR